MNLDRVAVTGADDSADPEDLARLSEEFPFVEWGILVSRSNEGGPRFPGRPWVRALLAAVGPEVKLSLHVCGRWVRQLLAGHDDLFREWGDPGRFQRVQVNTHAAPHDLTFGGMTLIRRRLDARQVIVQMDGTGNESILGELIFLGADAVPLFDTSGGAGRVPGAWPPPIAGVPYHGYAGGLGPETLGRELPRIGAVAGEARIWIDMERRVRSADDRRFELDQVRRCLDICAPMVRICDE